MEGSLAWLVPTVQTLGYQSFKSLHVVEIVGKREGLTGDSLVILRCQNSTRAWCPLCAAEGEMIVLEDTGVISNLEKPDQAFRRNGCGFRRLLLKRKAVEALFQAEGDR